MHVLNSIKLILKFWSNFNIDFILLTCALVGIIINIKYLKRSQPACVPPEKICHCLHKTDI